MRARAGHLIDRAVRCSVTAVIAARRWFRRIRHRLTNEPGYAEAVAALVVAAADLFVDGQHLDRLKHRAAGTFVIVVRSLMGDGGMPDTY